MIARGPAWLGLMALLGVAIYFMATAKIDSVPTQTVSVHSQTTAVFNAAMIVFREGLEAILILAAITASFQGANRGRRLPVMVGAAGAAAATAATWFVVVALLGVASPLGVRLEAITGVVAIIVLLVVLNWFVHKVYWTGWIARHHRQRQKLLCSAGLSATLGLVMLGFTAVYREGFEIVLFLQNLNLKAGTTVVLEGVALGVVATLGVGIATFSLQRRLPYRRMLIVTGVLIAIVLMVMCGSTARTFIDLGWLPVHRTPFSVPNWLGAWFEIYPYWETIAIQLGAGVFVVGSYYLAEAAKRGRLERAVARNQSAQARNQPIPAPRGDSALKFDVRSLTPP